MKILSQKNDILLELDNFVLAVSNEDKKERNCIC